MFGMRRRARLKAMSDHELAAYAEALMATCDKQDMELRQSEKLFRRPSVVRRWCHAFRTAMCYLPVQLGLFALLRIEYAADFVDIGDRRAAAMLQNADELEHAVKELKRRVATRDS
jgi:hypothetical protein